MTLGTIVVGGGTGFIGSSLCRALQRLGYNVLKISRQPSLGSMSWNEIENDGLPKSCVAVVNLAGQNILDPMRRWTPGFQQNVIASRVKTTKLLADCIQNLEKPPKVFATISGVGYYEPSETIEYTEDSLGGKHDFFAKLCSKWESSGNLPAELGVRRIIVRSGIVIGREGGMIQRLFWPFYFGMGGPIGSGKQYMPWIHVDDIVGIFVHAIQNETVQGVLNGVAPELITHKQFVTAFAKAMSRPSFMPLPPLALTLAFGPERAKMMTESLKIIPERTLDSGYKFLYPDIKTACEECAHVFVDIAKHIRP